MYIGATLVSLFLYEVEKVKLISTHWGHVNFHTGTHWFTTSDSEAALHICFFMSELLLLKAYLIKVNINNIVGLRFNVEIDQEPKNKF